MTCICGSNLFSYMQKRDMVYMGEVVEEGEVLTVQYTTNTPHNNNLLFCSSCGKPINIEGKKVKKKKL